MSFVVISCECTCISYVHVYVYDQKKTTDSYYGHVKYICKRTSKNFTIKGVIQTQHTYIK